jgi:LAO/AO transport system kinase
MSAPILSARDTIDRYFPDAAWPRLLPSRDALTLGRCLTLIESGLVSSAYLLQRASRPAVFPGRTIGITGPPGAGKSTLVGGLIGAARARDETVAVLAVDPSSPHSGGALLGDRLRMGMRRDDGVFIRSIASRGHLGGTATCAEEAIKLLSSLFDNVIVETVGAGQSEVEIEALVSICVVVCVPGLGDEIQLGKSGILEIADVLVVNQADKPGAADTVRQLEQIFPGKPVIETVATRGEGVSQLLEACRADASAGVIPRLSSLAARRAIERELARALLSFFSNKAGAEAWCAAVGRVRAGEAPSCAAAALLQRVTG